MHRNVFNQYPDYMQDFAEIKKFAAAQWEMMNMTEAYIGWAVETALANRNTDGIWKALIPTSNNITVTEMLPVIFALNFVSTCKNIEEHLYRWVGWEHCRVEYLPDTMTVKIKTDKNFKYEQYEKYVRWFIPYNLSYEIEKVEELD